MNPTFAVALICLGICLAQQCQPFNPAYAPASRDICPPFLHDLVSSNTAVFHLSCDILHIWSPLSLPSAQVLIDDIFNSSELWYLKAIQAVTPIDCYQNLISLSCNSAFQPCNNVWIPELNYSGIYPQIFIYCF